jgi:hypothetical protein
MFLQETGKFNGIAMPDPDDPHGPLIKYNEYTSNIINCIKIFCDESKFNKEHLRWVIFEISINKFVNSKLFR